MDDIAPKQMRHIPESGLGKKRQPVCGDLEEMAAATDLKISQGRDSSLAPFAGLRSEKLQH